jgi:pimeloyl-ACP methyl ester carboxylesterase
MTPSAREERLVKAISPDGTEIACWVTGQGPPLVLVHGGIADHTRWGPANPGLGEHFTVYSIDRRGRGGSGDSKEYSLEREFEDVASVVDSIPRQVGLLGHSYGGICALETALRTRNIQKLILYEPAIFKEVPSSFSSSMAKVQALIEAGDREKAVIALMGEGTGMSAEEIERTRLMPQWPYTIATVHTIPREIDAGGRYVFDPKRFSSLTLPILLLTGSESPALLKQTVEVVHKGLPTSRIVEMRGVGHAAGGLPGPGTDVFVQEVTKFLKE